MFLRVKETTKHHLADDGSQGTQCLHRNLPQVSMCHRKDEPEIDVAMNAALNADFVCSELDGTMHPDAAHSDFFTYVAEHRI